ncbi:cell division protein FtsX [Pedobacter yulinensis]|uniref:Cell division protein FtsX n=1 Tax=Pedobacter yulinensis TaxID=2126353 RepID=A0A2T3HM75_9SPHI|nr:ABC transporter permease [Pedobacter yulinensis]PST83534.1 cell division protein FtsX [Pedobacter yulinensis]
MFKLNIRIALRSLLRNKPAALINITGLTIGLTACLMLLLYVTYERNFDRHDARTTRVYGVMTNVPDGKGGITATFDGTTTALAPMLRQSLPALEAVCRLSYGSIRLIASGEHAFKKEARFAEPEIFQMYGYRFLSGDSTTALADPHSVVLTASMAKTLFGRLDVTGSRLRYQDQYDLKVTAVIEDLPLNSSNRFDYLMPWLFYETVDPSAKELNWTNYSFITLLKLKPGIAPETVNKSLVTLLKSSGSDSEQPHFIFPLQRLHLYGKFEQGRSVGGDIEQVRLFTALALGILLLACINFMNLATARAGRRAREVGVKKTLGADRRSLVFQFLTESMVLCLISVALAVALAELLIPAFNSLLRVQLNVGYFNGTTWLALLAIVLFTGILAGSYPAFYLSSFNVIGSLKRNAPLRRFLPFSMRQVLVVVQFCFAVSLIVATLVIYKQISYIKNRPLGVEVQALVEMPLEGNLKTRFELFKKRLLASGAVSAMYQSSVKLAHHSSNFTDIRWPGMQAAVNRVMFNKVGTGYDFIKTNGIKMLAGRDFSPALPTDSGGVLLSARAAKIMGLKDPLGKVIQVMGERRTVIGVFADYVWDEPAKTNNPMVVQMEPLRGGSMTMRLNTAHSLEDNIAAISKIAREMNPAYPVELSFMNQVYAGKLESERLLGLLSRIFGGLAILISCLGLYGLVSFSAEQRTREFGVRRVLGATLLNIMQLLSAAFLKLIAVALVIAVPLSCALMNTWLQGFEFHTSVSFWTIAVATLLTLALALVTIGLQAVQAARANPVDALKYE